MRVSFLNGRVVCLFLGYTTYGNANGEGLAINDAVLETLDVLVLSSTNFLSNCTKMVIAS